MIPNNKIKNEYILSSKQLIPNDKPNYDDHFNYKKQVYRISLLNNPATMYNEKEIKKMFEIRDKYNDQVLAAKTNHDIEVFEGRFTGKTPKPIPEIPIPSGLKPEIIRANEPSSAIRMYSIPEPKQESKTFKNRALTSLLKTRKSMVHKCPYCNPDPPSSPAPVKQRNGSSHWQVLDEPMILSMPPSVFVEQQKPRPFYSSLRRSLNLTIPIVQDDLIEITESGKEKFIKECKKMNTLEDKQRSKLLHERSITSRNALRRRQQDTNDLLEKSGQLQSQEMMTMKKEEKIRKEEERLNSLKKMTKEEIEQMEAFQELTKYDNNMWNAIKLKKTNDPLNQLLNKEGKLPRMSTEEYLRYADPSVIMID